MCRKLLFLLLAVLFVTTPAVACEWDYDTLRMEREKFPGALELIVGKFLRHSDPFYERRVRDRAAQLEKHEAGDTPLSEEKLGAVYDDWAVALDKLGRHDEALQVIDRKADVLPSVGTYETHANRGTFLVHSGRLEEGLADLKRAVEINPDAHFGREKYQIALIEYVLEKRGSQAEISVPLAKGASPQENFVGFVISSDDRKMAAKECADAIQGVLGMMRFGDFQSPILLEALGDLMFSSYSSEGQELRLAARAYLRAAEFSNDADAAKAYAQKAHDAYLMQHPDEASGERKASGEGDGFGASIRQLKDQLRREVREANDWFEQVKEDEALWVEVAGTERVRGRTPDELFWRKYGNQDIRVGHDRIPPARFMPFGLSWPIRVALGSVFVLTVLFVVFLIRGRQCASQGSELREGDIVNGVHSREDVADRTST